MNDLCYLTTEDTKNIKKLIKIFTKKNIKYFELLITILNEKELWNEFFLCTKSYTFCSVIFPKMSVFFTYLFFLIEKHLTKRQNFIIFLKNSYENKAQSNLKINSDDIDIELLITLENKKINKELFISFVEKFINESLSKNKEFLKFIFYNNQTEYNNQIPKAVKFMMNISKNNSIYL